MKHDSRDLRLRMEMVRVRAALERAEVAAAMADLRAGTRHLRALVSAAGNVGAVLSGGRDGWPGLLARTVSRRPWLAALALGALRYARRHRWLTIAAAGAVAVVVTRTAKRAAPAAREP